MSLTVVRNDTTWQRRITVSFWVLAVVLGALHAWDGRHSINTDGVSYLDMGEAFWRGDRAALVNGIWSPLYPFLLGFVLTTTQPSPYWEFSVVHAVNFAIYLSALCSFHFFLTGWIRLQSASDRGPIVRLPAWAWTGIGYSLFIWSSLYLITIRWVTPDTAVAALVYLACGILVRIAAGSGGQMALIALGVVLAMAYLAKAVMFPLAFVFSAVLAHYFRKQRRDCRPLLAGVVAFASVAGPWLVAYSMTTGRVTFSEVGRLTYAWYVNPATRQVHWQGQPPGSGAPKHSTRKVFEQPDVYEFAAPIRGTFPIWFDPAYWNEGVNIRFDLHKQLSALRMNGGLIAEQFTGFRPVVLAAAILFMMSPRRRFGLRAVTQRGLVALPALAGLAAYAFVHVEPRYIAAFVVVAWLALLSALTFDSRTVNLQTSAATVSIGIAIAISGSSFLWDLYDDARDAFRRAPASQHEHWEVAMELARLGVKPGDPVALIGSRIGWARVARVRIIAHSPDRDGKGRFWDADPTAQLHAMRAFAGTGAKAVVTNGPATPIADSGWHRIRHTDYYVQLL